MQGLHHQRTARPEQGGYGAQQGIHGLAAKQGKTADHDVGTLAQRATRDVGVVHREEAAATRRARRIDQRRHGVDTEHIDALHRQRTRQPALAAAEIDDAARPARQHGVEDGAIGDLLAAGDGLFAHRARPWRGVGAPGFKNGVLALVHR